MCEQIFLVEIGVHKKLLMFMRRAHKNHSTAHARSQYTDLSKVTL